MYIFEVLAKMLKGKPKEDKDTFFPSKEEEVTFDPNCEHIYMPIDSTGETLACTKCGALIKRSALEKSKNPFLKD